MTRGATCGQAPRGGGSVPVDQLLAVGQDEAQTAERDGATRKLVKRGHEEHVGQGHLRGRGDWRPGDGCPQRYRGSHAGFEAVLVEAVAAPGACVVDAPLALHSSTPLGSAQ